MHYIVHYIVHHLVHYIVHCIVHYMTEQQPHAQGATAGAAVEEACAWNLVPRPLKLEARNKARRRGSTRPVEALCPRRLLLFPLTGTCMRTQRPAYRAHPRRSGRSSSLPSRTSRKSGATTRRGCACSTASLAPLAPRTVPVCSAWGGCACSVGAVERAHLSLVITCILLTPS